jgi:hypothetical protein
MPPSLRRLGQRLGAVGPGFVNAFLRDNKVLPPVLALLALVVFAWVVAGTFVGGPDGEQVSNQSSLAQSQNAPADDPVAPEAENRDVDSYAAYRNKDPFRQLLASPEDTSGQSTGETTPPGEDTNGTTDSDGSGSSSGNSPRPTDGGAGRTQDTDNDGLTDRREAALAQDPQNPDTDGDGVPDGADDSDGDGRPDGRASGAGNSAGSDADSRIDDGGASVDASAPSSDTAGGNGRGGSGGRGGDGGPGRGDDLLDSGGNLYAP